MFANDQKQKILKNTNSQNEIDNNIKYPNLYSHTRYGYNNNSNKNRLLSSNSKNSNLSRSSSGFFERNYNNYLKKIYMKKNFINSSMIKKRIR